MREICVWHWSAFLYICGVLSDLNFMGEMYVEMLLETSFRIIFAFVRWSEQVILVDLDFKCHINTAVVEYL